MTCRRRGSRLVPPPLRRNLRFPSFPSSRRASRLPVSHSTAFLASRSQTNAERRDRDLLRAQAEITSENSQCQVIFCASSPGVKIRQFLFGRFSKATPAQS
ncbi:Hypothetical protein NTJ_06672 [Nesidiocoris tenuis]|uniref:Uncharacterized protein n=1 Tax=Nesidiocoris tenuis TaxID=355587 RepID=A0ABN7AP78_9HEMI|nr:Hypothetical protein NTJ_06672 [Nesidiocoris tenuis]